ncbi:MAG: hypothetical protein LBS30_05720 [Planctomycetota bacterium]|jgi:hypothetical protein|nr:hypothetical protein [Planctomycetota bacterium]
MRKIAWPGVFFLALALFSANPVAAQETPLPDSRAADQQTDERLGAIDSALDELNSKARDYYPEQRASRGERINSAFAALTGEAVNPLFGVTALGMYNYFKAPEHLRESLPLYDQPVVWAPLACLILLMLFNSTICEAMPFLKVPLNALGDIVNKAGAVAVLPLVIKMFADAVAQPAAEHIASAAGVLFPVAHAGEAGMMSAAWMSLGWLAGAIIGLVAYAAVWLTFNVIDVLILVCPFPGVDAMLKSFRLAVMGILAGANHLSPTVAVVLAVALTAACLFVAGWSFRLSVFGLVFSSDIIFSRKRAINEEGGTRAFSCAGLKDARGVPMRTWGRLETNSDGELTFSYRPWLALPRREAVIGKPSDFAAGRGLLNPFLMADAGPGTPWLRLPPRYRGGEGALADAFGLRGVTDCGAAGAIRSWLGEYFGGEGAACGKKHAAA